MFWYGASFESLRHMPQAYVRQLADNLPSHKAQLVLLLTQATMFPHLSKEDQEEWIDRIESQLGEPGEEKIQTAEDLKSFGIRRVKVKAKKKK